MNFIFALILAVALAYRFQVNLIWVALFFLLAWIVVKSLKKAVLKVAVFVLALALVILYPVEPAIPSLSPSKTYSILSEDREGDAVGTYQVNDYHLEFVRSTFPESTRFTEYGDLDDAFEDLDMGRIHRLVIDRSLRDGRGTEVGAIVVESENLVLKDMSVDPFLVYISGLDTEGASVMRSRSDMNLLLAVNPVTKEANIVSLARDTYLPLACQNGAMDKLTHAGLYGVDCQVRSVEALLNVEIDYYVRVHFSGFVNFIDTLGGVTLDNPEAFDDFPKGDLSLDGERALRFVRARDGVDQGDVGRGMNAQLVLNAVYESMAASSNRTLLLRDLFPIIDTNIDFANALRFSKNAEGYLMGNHVLRGEGDMQSTFSQQDGFKYYVFWPQQESIDEINGMIRQTLKGE